MSAEDAELLKLENASGFAFQLAIEDHVRQTRDEHGWYVEAREVPWRDEDGETGYLDLLLSKGSCQAFIECKRTRDARWVFLVPSDMGDSYEARIDWREVNQGRRRGSWFNWHVHPYSPTSAFCAVRGSSGSDAEMLERVCSHLVRAQTALSDIWCAARSQPRFEELLLPLPLLVTNAQLFVSRFDPGSVGLDTGLVETHETQRVDLVRFQKPLAVSAAASVPGQTLSDLAQAAERTVFVVNASALLDFVRILEVLPRTAGSLKPPWKQPW